eukprot:scaffold2322_cov135-Cylindrotheca_fusiformis.AAC.15
MGNYDPRDPDLVANHICENLLRHWDDNDDAFSQQQRRRKPKIIVTQGDPLSEKGISAITPRVAKLLGNVPRCLIVLDDEIADYHSPNADRDNVVLEYKYSQLTSVLEEEGKLVALNDKIDALLEEKNHKRTQVLNKPPLKDYFRDFARLQEVTKAACNILCGGDLTVAHTAKTISEFSVTSFYQASLELELVHPDQMVPYQLEDELDFDLIDKR